MLCILPGKRVDILWAPPLACQLPLAGSLCSSCCQGTQKNSPTAQTVFALLHCVQPTPDIICGARLRKVACRISSSLALFELTGLSLALKIRHINILSVYSLHSAPKFKK